MSILRRVQGELRELEEREDTLDWDMWGVPHAAELERVSALLHDEALHKTMAERSRIKAKVCLELLVAEVGKVELFRSQLNIGPVEPMRGYPQRFSLGSVSWGVDLPGSAWRADPEVYVQAATTWGRVYFGERDFELPLSRMPELVEKVRERLAVKKQRAMRLRLEWDLLRWALHSPDVHSPVGTANGILSVFNHHGFGEELSLNLNKGGCLEIGHPNLLGQKTSSVLSFCPKGPHERAAWCWDRVEAAGHVAQIAGTKRTSTRGGWPTLAQRAQEAVPFRA